ncbi:uncharacterized protein LOC113311970 [Papaver somniferum]|uniref:uncharacterized protein LOC113311970 n=1 Tax=Papaver somniferum TaxID=3469 RepID=UPI000E6FC8AC|nr:uncharacterized protein LOC113311970 [Papaver somniferum]
MKYIWNGYWEVETQILKLRFWEPNFNPTAQRTTTAFVWINISGLGMEYWKEKILMSLGDTFGRAIKVDETTLKREVGYYASVLVEVDLANNIPNQILVKSKYGSFEQEVQVPNSPGFCGHCKMVGHLITECRLKRKDEATEADNDGNPKLIRRKVWKRKEKRQSPTSLEPWNPFFASASKFQVLVEVAEEQSSEKSMNVSKPGTKSVATSKATKDNNKAAQSKDEPTIRVRNNFVKNLRLPGMSHMLIHNSTDTEKGNIWLLWHSYLSTPIVVSSTKQAIIVRVGEVLIIGIHAACLTVDRRILWEELMKISQMNCPWLITGDFDTLQDQESNILGAIIEWVRRGYYVIWIRLFFNVKWMEKYDDWRYKVGVRGVSDHGALLGGTNEFPKPNNIPFKYQNIWTSDPEFKQFIQASWEQECSGNPSFKFMSKLKRFKVSVKTWNWEVFGDLSIKVKETEEEVLNASLLSDAQPENVELLNKLETARGKHEIVANQYNELMRSKSRVKWVKEGGANTGFFHTSMKVRRAHNNIVELENTTGNIVTNQENMAELLVSHFKKKFEYHEVILEEELLDIIPKVITDEDNAQLDKFLSDQEIKEVVFSMDQNSSPGPDGFPASFYRFSWDIIGKNLIEAIQYNTVGGAYSYQKG